MSSEHTPGPWVIEVMPNHVQRVTTYPHRLAVADVLTPEDARLIAAAPELLEAAKAVRDCIEIRSLMVNDEYRRRAIDQLVTCEKAIQALIAAIRKAEGQ